MVWAELRMGQGSRAGSVGDVPGVAGAGQAYRGLERVSEGAQGEPPACPCVQLLLRLRGLGALTGSLWHTVRQGLR